MTLCARRSLCALALAVLALGSSGIAAAATIAVTSTADTVAVDGSVTLREAITSMNGGANVADVVAVGAYGTADTIDFNIGGPGPHTIALTSALPDIVVPVTIDGYSQPSSSPNSAAVGDTSDHQIVIDGTAALTHCLSLVPGSSGSTVRGLVIGNCAGGAGILVSSSNNVIAGNFIGTDVDGTAAAPNSIGVLVAAIGVAQVVDDNRIGGSAPADRNVISGNSTRNLFLAAFDDFITGVGSGDGNLVQGNYLGTNAAGTAALGGLAGVRVDALTNTTIGGASGSLGGSCTGVCNLVSGNTAGGVEINEPTTAGTLVQGNFIGTDVTGTLGLGNGLNRPGVTANAGMALTIGGTTAGTGNLISGHLGTGSGIVIAAGVVGPVTIQGNFVGTTTSGLAALGNGGAGAHVFAAGGVVFGGTTAAARNVISSNGAGGAPDLPGILLEGTVGAIIQGNFIGAGNDGTTNLGNLGNGIDLTVGAAGTVIGPAASGGPGGNVIAFNGSGLTIGSGVNVASGVDHSILSSSIFGNGGSITSLGIDLDGNGPTANDLDDGDVGANNLQNFPVLTAAVSDGATQTMVTGTLNSDANQSFTIEFFSNAAASPQARTFLGSTVVTTVGNDAVINATLPVGVSTSEVVTATATHAVNGTSEISAPVAVTLAALSVSKSFAPPTIPPGGTSQLTITITNPNTVAATAVAFTDTYPAGLTNAAVPAESTTCPAGAIMAVAGGGAVEMAGGTVPASGSCTVTVTVTAAVPGAYPNTIPAGGVTSANAGSNEAAASATLTVSVLAPPTVTKSFTPASIAVGGTSTLTITLGNSNAVAITGVDFTDTYPAGLVNAAAPAAATTCGGGVTAAAGGGSVALSGGTIPASGSCTVTVAVTSAAAGSYPNSIPAAGVASANAGSNVEPAEATLTVSEALAVVIPTASQAALIVLGLALAALGGLFLRRLA